MNPGTIIAKMSYKESFDRKFIAYGFVIIKKGVS